MSSDKYVVIKKKEWDFFNNRHRSQTTTWQPPPIPLEGAAVIRFQDFFAESVLHSYANAVQTAIEILQVTPGSDIDIIERLVQTRDDFHAMAMEAKEYSKKFPD